MIRQYDIINVHVKLFLQVDIGYRKPFFFILPKNFSNNIKSLSKYCYIIITIIIIISMQDKKHRQRGLHEAEVSAAVEVRLFIDAVPLKVPATQQGHYSPFLNHVTTSHRMSNYKCTKQCKLFQDLCGPLDALKRPQYR